MGGKRSAKKDINKQVNAEQALQLRHAGASYRAIANQLGISAPYAYRLVSDALAELAAQTMDKASELRQLESERLDRLFLAVYQDAVKGDLKAMDRALKIIQQRAKLFGLEAPQQHQISGAGGGALKIEWVSPVQPGDDIGEGADELPDAT